MNYFYIFIGSFAIALSGAIAPGPLLVTVISNSLKSGFKTGPLVILGHAILEICMVAVLVMGLGRFINTPSVIRVISIAGAAILLYFGIEILHSLPSVSINLDSRSGGKSSNLFFQGIAMSISNPYWTVWWLTIGLGLLLSSWKSGIPGFLFFFSGHILADLGWYSFISFNFSKGRKFLSLRLYRIIMGTSAVVIILFGLYFGVNACLS